MRHSEGVTKNPPNISLKRREAVNSLRATHFTRVFLGIKPNYSLKSLNLVSTKDFSISNFEVRLLLGNLDNTL